MLTCDETPLHRKKMFVFHMTPMGMARLRKHKMLSAKSKLSK